MEQGSNSCLGIIQAFPAGSTVNELADIVLGVPFLRSTYTVMAYDPPDQHGVFPNAGSTPSLAAYIRPQLGLLGLTDPATALDEFHSVRVLNQPLDKDSQTAPSGVVKSSSGHKISTGIAVLIGLLGFFALCVALFGARWAYGRRKYRLAAASAHGGGDAKHRGLADDDLVLQDVTLRLARRGSRTDAYGVSEDSLRHHRFGDEYKRRPYHNASTDSGKTRVTLNLDSDEVFFNARKGFMSGVSESGPSTPGDEYDDAKRSQTMYSEVGYLPGPGHDEDRTLKDDYSPVKYEFDHHTLLPRDSGDLDPDATLTSGPGSHFPYTSHTTGSIPDEFGVTHDRRGSLARPLLAHTRSEASVSRIDDASRRKSSLPPRGPRPNSRTSSSYSGCRSPLSSPAQDRLSSGTFNDIHNVPVLLIPETRDLLETGGDEETRDIVTSPQRSRPMTPPLMPLALPPPPPPPQSSSTAQLVTVSSEASANTKNEDEQRQKGHERGWSDGGVGIAS